jgi:hypothetical protein
VWVIQNIVHSLVDQASGRQLGHKAVTEILLKSTLMMIKALNGFIVHAADVNDDVACVEDSGVARPLQVYTTIRRGGVKQTALTSALVC